MDESNKKKFWLMINVAMELTNHPPLTKEAIVTWWHLLSKYEYEDVERAIDSWIKTMSKTPMPHDIAELCKPKVTIHSRLPSPANIQANQAYAKEVIEFVASHTTKKRDFKSWARKIIDNPSAYPDISLRFAREALEAKTA
jgi:hypothetical protein